MKSVYLALAALMVFSPVFAHQQAAAAGQPGEAKAVDHIIKISAEDIKFRPTEITVRAGETVRFVITNHGRLPHEFVIGTKAEQEQHEKEMLSMAPMDMEHTDPNAVSIKPGETGILTWKFGAAGKVEFACHVPGHYAAGMRGTIRVQ